MTFLPQTSKSTSRKIRLIALGTMISVSVVGVGSSGIATARQIGDNEGKVVSTPAPRAPAPAPRNDRQDRNAPAPAPAAAPVNNHQERQDRNAPAPVYVAPHQERQDRNAPEPLPANNHQERQEREYPANTVTTSAPEPATSADTTSSEPAVTPPSAESTPAPVVALCTTTQQTFWDNNWNTNWYLNYCENNANAPVFRNIDGSGGQIGTMYSASGNWYVCKSLNHLTVRTMADNGVWGYMLFSDISNDVVSTPMNICD